MARLTCYSTAFIAQECQAGLRCVPVAQHQAAAALGLTPRQAFRFVELPQAVHISIPPLFRLPMNILENSSLSLIGGAYLAHSVHAGIVAAGDGQWQAGLSPGLSRVRALRYVLLPQALRIMAPSLANQWVSLIKDTSLAYVIGVGEPSFVATQIFLLSRAVYGVRPHRDVQADAAHTRRAPSCQREDATGARRVKPNSERPITSRW